MKLLLTIALLLITTVCAAAERIVSLKPNITEILFALGTGSEVVGVTRWCDRPKEAMPLPKVADYINIDTEKIIALKPTLIIGSRENSLQGQFTAFESAGLKTLFLPFQNTQELFNSTQKIADTLGKSREGETLVAKMKKEIKAAKAAATAEKRALILVGHKPLIAAGENTFLGEILALAGATNVINAEKIPYPTISAEFILEKKPDIIFDLGMGSDVRNSLGFYPKDQIVHLSISDFRAGPTIGDAVKLISKELSDGGGKNL